MSETINHNESSGLSKPLSGRERRRSQRAFIVMAMFSMSAMALMGPSGLLGVYLKQLGVSAEQLGTLVGSATPFGILGLFCAGLTVRIGRKRMLGWALVPTGLLIIALLLLPQVKERWGFTVMLMVCWAMLASRRVCQALTDVPWFPLIQMITKPRRRGAFLGKMRTFWSLGSVVILMISARLLNQETGATSLVFLIVLSGVLYLLVLIPLSFIVEHRTERAPTRVGWQEAWKSIKDNPLYVRGLGVTFAALFGGGGF